MIITVPSVYFCLTTSMQKNKFPQNASSYQFSKANSLNFYPQMKGFLKEMSKITKYEFHLTTLGIIQSLKLKPDK